MEWYLAVLRKYAVFTGRARRKEFWMFTLVNLIISLVLGVLGRIVGMPVPILGWIYSLAVLIPGIAVGIRRLHDIDRTGWWLLAGLVPILGWIVLLVFAVQEGTPGDNQYGANPKAVAAGA